MEQGDLQRLVAQPESETLELKKSTAELTAALRTVCAFLNSHGGKVVIGATPQGKLIGQEVSDQTERDIAQALSRFEPAAPVSLQVVPLPDTRRAAVILDAQHEPYLVPFAFEGRAYQRIGAMTTAMPQARYHQLLLNRTHSHTRWETATAAVEMEALDHNQILRAVRSGIASGRLPESTGRDVADILDRLELRRDDELVNAAPVLFGSEAALRDFPQCQIRLARFRGTTKSEFLDNRRLRGHAFVLLDEALVFLQRHSAVAAWVEPDRLERVEQPSFPLEALREALVNAICHRDYMIIGGAINVAIFDDRIEIWSDGTLPAGLRVEDLKREHVSRPRNPTIADVLFRHGLVEAWGRGTQKIVELCLAAGQPEPEFLEVAGSVGVRFLAGDYHPPYRVGYDLNPRQREILAVLAQGSAPSSGDILARLPHKVPERTLRRELEELRHLGLVRSTGRTRSTVWSLEKQGEQ